MAGRRGRGAGEPRPRRARSRRRSTSRRARGAPPTRAWLGSLDVDRGRPARPGRRGARRSAARRAPGTDSTLGADRRHAGPRRSTAIARAAVGAPRTPAALAGHADAARRPHRALADARAARASSPSTSRRHGALLAAAGDTDGRAPRYEESLAAGRRDRDALLRRRDDAARGAPRAATATRSSRSCAPRSTSPASQAARPSSCGSRSTCTTCSAREARPLLEQAMRRLRRRDATATSTRRALADDAAVSGTPARASPSSAAAWPAWPRHGASASRAGRTSSSRSRSTSADGGSAARAPAAAAPNGRIEEHGLHLWLGYYENAFRLLRECYAELDRPAHRSRRRRSRPGATRCFPAATVGLEDRRADGWHHWLGAVHAERPAPGRARRHEARAHASATSCAARSS